jgi:hypothetical protein
VNERRWPEPPHETVVAGLQALADEYALKHPQLHVVPLEPGQVLPPGARYLPAALPLQHEPILDRRKPRTRKRRSDNDLRDD